MIITINSAYAEVIDLKTDSDLYVSGDNIKFQGRVEQGDSGLITIVIRDPDNNFLMLEQSISDQNYNYEKIVKIDDRFSKYGQYNATGFIVNMTAGITTTFNISDENVVLQPNVSEEKPTSSFDDIKNTSELNPDSVDKTESEELQIIDFVDPQKDPKYYVDYPNYTIEEAVGYVTPVEKKILGFVDPQKDPKYYVDRYYNEPEYKSWFDRNYPNYTIEEAVGYDMQDKSGISEIMKNKIIPDAQAISTIESPKHEDNSGTAQLVLAVGGLGILFGAVYGVKKKVDDNSKQISVNKDTIRKRIINPLFGSNTSDILQTRLAKGEITLEEYDVLERKLSRKY